MLFKQFPVRPRHMLIATTISILILFFRMLSYFTHIPPFIVFCSVGQGNATYIRLENSIDILIDAGPDETVSECLRKYMPFNDRRIDYVFITHPQLDHIGGLFTLAHAYDIGLIFQYCSFMKNCVRFQKGKKIMLSRPRGEYSIGNSTRVSYFIPAFGYINSDLNKDSVVYKVQTNGHHVLIPGDIPTDGLRKAMYEHKDEFKNIDILMVPHHGSRTSVSIPFYRFVKPTLAIISVGKNNSYGHPSKYLLDTLQKFHIRYKRTDIDGDIVISLKSKK